MDLLSARRLIDLSYAAAVRLGMQGRGTAPVEVVALEPYQFLPKLAARRAEQRELLASRASRAKPETGAAEIEFIRATPIQPSAQAPAQPQAPVLASLEQNPSPVQVPVRLARADVEPAAPKAVAKAPVRLARAKGGWNPSPAKAPIRLARVDGERNAHPAKAPVRLALADVERAAPKTVTKAANGKPAKAEEDRNPDRISRRPSSGAPAAKGREAVVKPPVPAPNANRNGKPVSPRQASESKPMAVRLASLKLNRSRGVAD